MKTKIPCSQKGERFKHSEEKNEKVQKNKKARKKLSYLAEFCLFKGDVIELKSQF